MKGILLALSLAIGLSSCTKELDERIVGTWNYTVDYRLDQGWYDEIIREEGHQDFNADGSGKQVNSNGFEWSFTWEIEGNLMKMYYPNNTPEYFEYEVITNEKDLQIWTSAVELVFDSVPYNYEVELTLRKP